jgi:hypothetical protein
MSTMFKWYERHISLVLMLFVLLAVVPPVIYDIYQTPPDPHFVYAARIKISGTGQFESDVGTPSNEYTIHGKVSQGDPITIDVPYRRADWVSANMRWADGASGTTKIRVGCHTVAKRTAHVVMWKVPKSWADGMPPTWWVKKWCPKTGDPAGL